MRVRREHVEAMREAFETEPEMREIDLDSGVDGRLVAKKVVVQETFQTLALKRKKKSQPGS